MRGLKTLPHDDGPERLLARHDDRRSQAIIATGFWTVVERDARSPDAWRSGTRIGGAAACRHERWDPADEPGYDPGHPVVRPATPGASGRTAESQGVRR